jgi:hypothetical protein
MFFFFLRVVVKQHVIESQGYLRMYSSIEIDETRHRMSGRTQLGNGVNCWGILIEILWVIGG